MIARTGYIVSCISYVVFLTLDWLRPGFVSNFLSPHVFFLAAIIFGILWARVTPYPYRPSPYSLLLTPFLTGLVLAIFSWSEGRPLGDFRVLVSLVAFVVPFLVFQQFDRDL